MQSLQMPSAMSLPPGEGQALWVLGDHYTVKVSGEQTNGAFALVECRVAPQSGTPPHIHHAEDEMFYILEGVLTLWVAHSVMHAGPGAFIQVPRGTLHMFRNETGADVRMLVMLAPAGFENFFLAIGTPVSEQQPNPPPVSPEIIERLMELAPRFHMEVTTL